MRKTLALFLAACAALVGFADGESLEETGGYVPTSAPGLAFKGITLADLGTTVFPSASKGGAWAGGEAEVPLFCRAETYDGSVLQSVVYQAQWIDGSYIKSVSIRFTNGDGGVYAQTVSAKYTNSNIAAAYCTDFSGTVGYVADSAAASGYGILGLKLYAASDLSSININFNATEDTKLTATSVIGPTEYAVSGQAWSQMLGTNNNTLDGLTIYGTTNGAPIYAAVSANVTITGTRGTYSTGLYTAASDVRYGYIDEDANNTAPTVTVTGVPFAFYRVVFIPSTDSSDRQFGYISVNGKKYTSDNTEKATDKDYETIEGATSWGKTQVSDYIHGVNYLVTPIIVNNSGKTLTVSGHAVGSARGCIAAIQIVRADPPETLYAVTATGDVTWSTKAGLSVDSGSWTSGNTIKLINNLETPVTVTFDEVVNAAGLILSGSGTTTIKFSDSADDRIESFDFDDVSGEVVLDDYMQTIEFIPPAEGTVRYGGEAILKIVPCASGAVTYTVIVDQPIAVSEFALAGIKSDYRFGENMVGSFDCFVLGDSTGSNQTITQLGGLITVNGSNESGNQASVLLGHWGGLTVNLNTYAGTFTALNAAARLGHTGKCYWTIGDGVSEDASTAVANLKGVKNTDSVNTGSGSKIVIRKGGTLNLGESGIALPNSSVELSGGMLVTDCESEVPVSASSITAISDTATELNTANGLMIASAVSGSGNIRKTGAGTLMLSAAATATGTLTVEEGTLTLSTGVTWSGAIVLGEGAALNIADESITTEDTPYIDICQTLDADAGAIKINGEPINTTYWKVQGGQLINQSLIVAKTTISESFRFSAAKWQDILDNPLTVDWDLALAEIRVNAANVEPSYAYIDVVAADVKRFIIEGEGDLAVYKEGKGSMTANEYDFSGATGKIDYRLNTGTAPVKSGTDTRLSGGGKGDVSVAAGSTVVLGPWGEESGTTNTYSATFNPAVGATMVFCPGEGRVQKTGGFGNTNQSTTIAVTNGTLVVDKAGGGDSAFFGDNSVRIDDGGIVSLEAQDALGYSNARPVTINKGGVLAVKVRDTLRRTVNFYGGMITIEGVNGGRGLDFHGCEFNIFDDASVEQLEERSPVMLRRGETVINVADGKAFDLNANISAQDAAKSILVRSASGAANQNGRVRVNGYGPAPKQTFHGETKIGASGRAVIYELNCEHQNGKYVVNAGSRLMGSGSVTGEGGVTLSAANSKICGGLTINNVTAEYGGTFGDEWNPVGTTIVDSFTAAGTQSIENGSLTILDTCVVTNAAGVVDTTEATFNIKSSGRLVVGKSLDIGGLTVDDGGAIVIPASRDSQKSVFLTVAGETTCTGKAKIVLDFGDDPVPGNYKVQIPAGFTDENATVTDINSKRAGSKKWRIENGYAISNGGFYVIIR